jgi:O-antigen/teichoic acid export membrane protein
VSIFSAARWQRKGSAGAPDDNLALAEPQGDSKALTKGAKWLFLRQAVGLVIGAGGLFVVTQRIGPAAYAVYASAFVIWFTIQTTTEFSIDVWLVRRRHGTDDVEAARTAQTLLLISGVLGAGICLALATPIQGLNHLPSFSVALSAMAPLVFLVNISQVALSTLERAFEFKYIGFIELTGQVVFVLVSVGVSYLSKSYLCLLMGLIAQQVVVAGGFLSRNRKTFGAGWSPLYAREALRFGSTFTTSTVAGSVRGVLIAVLVPRLIGAPSAGVVQLVLRLVEQIGLLRQVVTRISYPLFGRMRGNTAELRQAFATMQLWMIAGVGFPMLIVAWFAAPLGTQLLGARWNGLFVSLPYYVLPALVVAVTQLYQSLLAGQDAARNILIGSLFSAFIFAGVIPVAAMHDRLRCVAVADLVAGVTVIYLRREIDKRIGRTILLPFGLLLLGLGVAAPLKAVVLRLLASCLLLILAGWCIKVRRSSADGLVLSAVRES